MEAQAMEEFCFLECSFWVFQFALLYISGPPMGDFAISRLGSSTSNSDQNNAPTGQSKGEFSQLRLSLLR